jgi:protease-4
MISPLPDLYVERLLMKASLKKWRFFSAMLVIIFCAFLLALGDWSKSRDYLAEVVIEKVITDNPVHEKRLQLLAEDSAAKGVLIYINSPGGTAAGGEMLYEQIRAIAKTKPVVAVLGEVATSGGYMAALAADHIIARRSTMTGSIGVVMQTAEFVDLAKKIGVNLVTLKSGALKATPSPFEKTTLEANQALQETIHDIFAMFLGMVKDRRKLSKETMALIADGRVISGERALALHLIDQIGGVAEGEHWLREKQQLGDHVRLRRVSLDETKTVAQWFQTHIHSWFGLSLSRIFPLEGLLTIWHG